MRGERTNQTNIDRGTSGLDLGERGEERGSRNGEDSPERRFVSFSDPTLILSCKEVNFDASRYPQK